MLNYSIFPATWDIWKSCTCDAYLSTNAWRSQVHHTEPLFSSFCISTWNHNEVSRWQNCLLQQLQHRLKNSKAEAQQINGSPHIISVTCNLFSTVIRYLQREIIRKTSLMLFLWWLLFAEDLPTARTHYERDGALVVCSGQLCKYSAGWSKTSLNSNLSGVNWCIISAILRNRPEFCL